MEIQFTSLEEKLVYEGKLTQYQIEEIRRIFSLFDTDKSGTLTYNELAFAMQNLSKNTFTQEDYERLIQKIDINKDGVIEWQEFLKCVSEWLEIFEDSEIGKNQLSPIKRQKFHDTIKKFFLQFKTDFNEQTNVISESENIEDLENRSEEWDFNGEKIQHNSNKWVFLETATINLVDKFKAISNFLESNDPQSILSGLTIALELLRIGNLFVSSSERFKISHFLIKLFDYLDSFTIIKILKFLKEKRADSSICLECLKIITLFAPGPRLTNLNNQSVYHPSKMLHKNFLVQNDILEILYQIICKTDSLTELRDQALLALGSLTKNSPQIRDLILLQNGMNLIYENVYSADRTIKEMEKISWVFSVIAGVSLKIPIRDPEKLIILNKVFSELLFWRDNNEILTNSLLGLSYTLPSFIDCDYSNERTWTRILALLTHPSLMVKRASLICLGRIIGDDSQCQILIELKMVEMLSELLNYNSIDVKVSVIKILRNLLEKGYGLWVMTDVSLLKNIRNCMNHSQVIRSEIVRLLKMTASQNIVELNKSLINFNMIKGLVDNLQEFKEYDLIFSEVYGYMEPSYDLKMFIDVIKTLNYLVQDPIFSDSNNDYMTILLKEFNQNNILKIQKAIDTLFIDIQNKQIDYFVLSNSNEELGKTILELLNNIANLYKKTAQNPYSYGVITSLNTTIENYKVNFEKLKGILFTYQQNKDKIQIEIIAAEIDKLNNVKTFMIEPDKSLVEILLILENLFQISPINIYYYNEETNEKFLVDDNLMWNKVLLKSQKETKEKHMPKITVKLVLANAMKQGMRFFIPSSETNPQIFNYEMTNIFSNDAHTNLDRFESLLQELKTNTKLSSDDITILHQSFLAVTSHRRTGKEDGSVNFEEFLIITKDFVKDQHFAKEIFLLLNKNNLIDFRDFVRLIGVLKSNNLEDKLRLYFKTYDLDNNGFLDKNEIFEMLHSSMSTSGYLMPEMELKEKVNKIFEVSDLNKDGKLSYTEFKEAVSKNYLLINSLWLDPNQIKLNQMTNFFFRGKMEDKYQYHTPNKNFEEANQYRNKYNFQKFRVI